MNDRSEIDKTIPLESGLKRVQQALQASEQRLKEVQRVARLGTWEWVIATDTVTWSEEFYRIAGRDPAAPAPNFFAQHAKLFTAESFARLQPLVAEAIRSGSPYEVDLELIRPDGDTRWIAARGEAVRAEDGRIVGLRGTAQDITARKRAEDKIRESEKKFRALTDTSPVGVYLSSGPEEKGEYMSQTMTNILGYTLEDVPSVKSWWPTGYPDPAYREWVRKTWEERIARSIETHQPIEPLETIVTSKDGSKKNIVWGYISSGAGNWNWAMDITARKQAEDKIRESEKKFKALTDSSPLAIYLSSGPGEKGEYINPTFVKVFGYTLEEVPSVPDWWPIAYPDPAYRHWVRTTWEQRIARSVETHQPIEPLETVVTCKDGTKKNILWGYISSGAGNWNWAMDITERKRAEEALAAREFELREAQRLAHVGSWTWDTMHNVMQWSDEMYRIAGYQPQAFAITSDSVLNLIHPDEKKYIREKIARAAQGPQIQAFLEEYRIVRPDGSIRFVESRGEPILDGNGRVIALRGTWIDFTDRKRIEDALNKTLEDLRSAQEQVVQTEKVVALGTMAAGIAHELNNPLMGVMSFVNYARLHPTDPNTTELLGNAEQELDRMRDLIRSMLTFARPPQGKPSPVDVTRLIAHALELLKADLKARMITLEVEIEARLAHVTATPQLEQAILNLLLNARDAVSQARAKRIRVRGWSEGEHVFIEIADTGPGVPENIRLRIFDPFFTTKPPGEGTGLGLSVSRTVIQDMGGELILQSQEGEGARFLIRLNKGQPPR